MADHRRKYKRFQQDMSKRLQPEESKPETPSKKGRNARIRAYKRDKKRIEEFKQRALC